MKNRAVKAIIFFTAIMIFIFGNLIISFSQSEHNSNNINETNLNVSEKEFEENIEGASFYGIHIMTEVVDEKEKNIIKEKNNIEEISFWGVPTFFIEGGMVK